MPTATTPDPLTTTLRRIRDRLAIADYSTAEDRHLVTRAMDKLSEVLDEALWLDSKIQTKFRNVS